jgi:hypothetical protein
MTYNGGPAFPLAGTSSGPESRGMTLHDYFAAAVMTGLLANMGHYEYDVLEISAHAYFVAKHMLIVREMKSNENN